MSTRSFLDAPRGRAFRALRYRDFRLIFAAFLLSQSGFWITQISLQGLMARQSGNDPLIQGLLSFVLYLPGFLLAPPAGLLADRVSRKAIALLCQSGIALAAFLYLGRRDEVGTLSRLLQMKWLEQAADLSWLDGIGHRLHVPQCVRLADRWGIGWLPRALGVVVVLLTSVILSPLWLGYYISPYRLSQNKFFLDELYQWFLVLPLRKLADFTYAVDRVVVDGLVNLVGRLPGGLGALTRRWQTGVVPFYGLSMALGTLLIFLLSILFVRS